MTIMRNLLVCLMLLTLPSCTLIGSLLKIPLSILKVAGRTAGLNALSDAPALPVTDEQEIREAQAIGIDPVSTDTSAE